jgi:serine/threonine protein kinase/Tol biopolymer transport system component
MSLAAGTKLGPYEVVGAIGAGGMGEVYRARDTKLGREVALKVLPDVFAADTERMARFEREAKVLASLNHPNIASIYGFEDSGGVHALVMELVEGQTLAERIAGGVGAGLKPAPTSTHAIPIEEALPIARQIAEGLEYAHERGIVHRDLKPANVKITPDGMVKLLDFGLAKALEGDGATGSDPASSPTLSRLATQAGIILGTAAYMSPEQAKGRPVDRRADIWAFSCVLFEMLSGKKPFDGETITDVLAAVVRAEPDWSLLPAATPGVVGNLLRRCLKKDAKQRLQAIGDARIALEEILSGTAAAEETSVSIPVQRSRRQFLAWALVAVLATVAAGLGAWIWLSRGAPAAPAIVSQILPPPNANYLFGGNDVGAPAISPDGKWLAFVAAGTDGKQELWVRPLDATTAQPLAGTDGASYPFWSPDNRSIGFFANGNLDRIDASGGPPLTLAAAGNGRGGAWNQDGTILFAPTSSSPLFRVPASGGAAQQVTQLNVSRQESGHRWPQFLPDGKHFLVYGASYAADRSGTYAASLDSSAPTLIVRGNSNASYVPPGYLLFVRQGTLIAQRFDSASLRLVGQPGPLVEHAEVNSNVYRGVFTVSQNGILAYQAGGSLGQNAELLWFDRSGKQIGVTGEPGALYTPSLSPDDRKLAVRVTAPGTGTVNNIWIYDLAEGIKTRLTFSSANDGVPAWSPDGKTIAFASNRSGELHLYEKEADGTGSTSPLVVDNARETFPSFSSDGRYLFYGRFAAQKGSHEEIWAMPLFGGRKPFVVVQNPQFDVGMSALSPDGKWLAYESAESGRREIYVVPFLHGSGKWEVSTGGGTWPRWRHDGKELFYLSPDNKIMSAEISEQSGSLVIGKVALLFPVNPVSGGQAYDVSADGKKFVVDTQAAPKTSEPLTLVVNWPALLKKQ